MRKIRSNCYLSVFLRFELSFFLSIFFHILSWFLCIFSETEEYIAHQLFYPRKKTFSHNSLLLETHNILTFRGEEYMDQNTKYKNKFHEPAVKYINLSHPPLLKIHPFLWFIQMQAVRSTSPATLTYFVWYGSNKKDQVHQAYKTCNINLINCMSRNV